MKWKFIRINLGEEIDLEGWYVIETWQCDGICFMLLREIGDEDGDKEV